MYKRQPLPCLRESRCPAREKLGSEFVFREGVYFLDLWYRRWYEPGSTREINSHAHFFFESQIRDILNQVKKILEKEDVFSVLRETPTLRFFFLFGLSSFLLIGIYESNFYVLHWSRRLTTPTAGRVRRTRRVRLLYSRSCARTLMTDDRALGLLRMHACRCRCASITKPLRRCARPSVDITTIMDIPTFRWNYYSSTNMSKVWLWQILWHDINKNFRQQQQQQQQQQSSIYDAGISPKFCQASTKVLTVFLETLKLAHVFYEPLPICYRFFFFSAIFCLFVFFRLFGFQEIQNFRRDKKKKKTSSTAWQGLVLVEHVP